MRSLARTRLLRASARSCFTATARGLETGRRRQGAVGDDHRLEHRPHFTLASAREPDPRRFDVALLLGTGSADERRRALVETESAHEIALFDRPVDGRPGGPRAAPH